MAGARNRTLAALCLFTLMACATPRPESENKVTAVLDQLPVELPRGRTRTSVLLLMSPNSQPMYDTTRIAYMEMPHRIGYFSHHEWGATPSQMLQSLLLKMLDQAHYFRAVIVPPYAGQYDYVLQVGIQDLVQDFTSAVPMLRLSVHVQLNDGTSNRVLASREIALREAIRERTPLAGVEAANLAVAKALRELAAFLVEATR
jgi:cholesterol transport system auxiliary component